MPDDATAPAVTAAHIERESLSVALHIAAHSVRGSATPLFSRSRLALIEREGGRCWVCGRTHEQSGHPLEAHHRPIERCFAEITNYKLVEADALAGHLGPYAAGFDWQTFWVGATEVTIGVPATPWRAAYQFTYLRPVNPYLFVDDMRVNGRLLCKDHHTVKGRAYHTAPEPVILGEKYAIEGYDFSDVEVIGHAFSAADLAALD